MPAASAAIQGGSPVINQQLVQPPEGQQQQHTDPAAPPATMAAAAPVPPASTPSAPSAPAAQLKEVDHLVQEIKENLKLGHHVKNQLFFSYGASSSSSGGGPVKSSGGRGAFRSKSHRPSPYAVPPASRVGLNQCDKEGGAGSNGGSGAESAGPSQLRRWNHRRRYPSTCKTGADADADLRSDPFEMLQELITDGSLIKEAVRRLQLGLTPKYKPDVVASAASVEPAAEVAEEKRFYYDSDDECRTPPCCEDDGVVMGI